MNDNKQKLIKAVYEVTAASGIENATIDKICKIVKVSKQVVYNHYANKEALFERAFSAVFVDFDAEMREKYETRGLTENDISFSELSVLFWNEFLEFMVRNPNMALYFSRYRKSGYMTDEIWQSQEKNHKFFTNLFGKSMRSVYECEDRSAYVFIWSVAIDAALSLAIRNAKKAEPVTEAKKRAVYVFLKTLDEHVRKR